jgi:phosphoglucosamine mutase
MSKRKLFGTDGIRGEANQYPMTAEVAMRLGRALGLRLAAERRHRPRVLVGKDTRLSGYLFETSLCAGLVSAGADVYLVGPLPTPGIAFLTTGMRCDAGVVISASHNPYQDNGIKLFARDGYKLPDEEEAALEAMLFEDLDPSSLPRGAAIGRAHRVDDAAGRYAVYCKTAFPRDLTLEGVKIVVDCANGAAYRVAPEVFTDLGAEVVAVGCRPDGTNINKRTGALHPEYAGAMVRRTGAHLGVTLDGDADRCILCDERGEIVDGDQILAVLARDLKAQDKLPGDRVVATVMSNVGLERSLDEVGVQLDRVGVGDRYVVERMRASGAALGGEQSGHVILSSHATTGDGIVTALAVLGIMVRRQRPLSALASCMTRYPQVLRNVRVREKRELAAMPEVSAVVDRVESELGPAGRVLLRYSGTELLARVMVEGPDEAQIAAAALEIADTLLTALGAAEEP